MKTLLVGIGAAGNKAIMEAIESKVVPVEDTMIINSTTKDFPKDYKGKSIVLSPKDTGCGKERAVAKDYAITAIKSGKLSLTDEISKYTTIIVVTSVEGGTGSGSTPIIAKFFNQVCKKNVHIIAFTGFEEDVRGLGNTVEFFQEIDSNLIVQTIRNKAFINLAGGNKFRAEELANKEMCRRIEIIMGKNFIASEQNIDDTDILKVSNTSGYMTVEYQSYDHPLTDVAEFNKIIKKMTLGSKSVASKDPGAIRIGIILNISPASEDSIDYSFSDLKKSYGNPYECYMQKQWDDDREYIAFIVSGMKMPLDEIKAVYEKYKEQSASVNKTADSFYKEIQGMQLDQDDKKFDMIKPVEQGASVESFLNQFETKK